MPRSDQKLVEKALTLWQNGDRAHTMESQNRRPTKLEKQFPRDQLLKLWESNGKSAHQLAKQLKTDFGGLQDLLFRYEILPFTPNPKHAFLTKEVLAKDYQTLSISAIARKYRMSGKTVGAFLRHYKIPIRIAAYSVNEEFFTSDSPEVFYVAGLLAADGNIYAMHGRKNPGKLSFALKEEDLQHVENIRSVLQFTGPITKHTKFPQAGNPKHQAHSTYGFEISSEKMCADLKRFGITERKSLTYIMPEWLVIHPLVNYFLLGYFDGDGTIGVGQSKKHQYGLGFRGTVTHLQQIHAIFRAHKIVPDVDKVSNMDNGAGRIGYGGNPTCIAIYEFLLGSSSIYLQRKHDRYLALKKHYTEQQAKWEQEEQTKIQLIQDHQNGMRNKDLALKYNLPHTTVSTITAPYRFST